MISYKIFHYEIFGSHGIILLYSTNLDSANQDEIKQSIHSKRNSEITFLTHISLSPPA